MKSVFIVLFDITESRRELFKCLKQTNMRVVQMIAFPLKVLCIFVKLRPTLNCLDVYNECC